MKPEESEEYIQIKKNINYCIFCNNTLKLVKIGQYCVCEHCIKRLANAKPGDCLYSITID